MNDAFFASLGKRPKVEVEAEEEGEGCGVYLHLKELVATEDPSVHVYGRDWSVIIVITQDFAANHAKNRWETTGIPAGNTKLTVRA